MKHKKELSLLLVICVLIASLVTAAAGSAGSDSDPFVGLKWLQDTFLPQAEDDLKDHVDSILDDMSGQLMDAGAEGTEFRVKRGDVILLESGSTILPLAGEFSASANGTILDISEGIRLSVSGDEIKTAHRYLAAEDTSAAFSVNTDTGVVRLTGRYELSSSRETDYNALADALHTMGLFKGSDTPYGSGYDLELTPTRIEGLVMFLRLIGEEEAALAFTDDSVTFTDVPQWALSYVAYAYHKGYTKGQEVDADGQVTFGAENAMTPRDYMTFLLRALGYVENEQFKWKTAVADAQTLGVLTEGEVTLLTEKPFHRAQVVYLSYYALSTQTATGEGTLLDRLTATGAVDQAIALDTMVSVAVQRV